MITKKAKWNLISRMKQIGKISRFYTTRITVIKNTIDQYNYLHSEQTPSTLLMNSVDIVKSFSRTQSPTPNQTSHDSMEIFVMK